MSGSSDEEASDSTGSDAAAAGGGAADGAASANGEQHADSAEHADGGMGWHHDDSDGEVEEEGQDEAEAAALAALGGADPAALPSNEAIDWAAFLALSYPSSQHWTAVVEAGEAEAAVAAGGSHAALLARACRRPAAMVWHRLELKEEEEEGEKEEEAWSDGSSEEGQEGSFAADGSGSEDGSGREGSEDGSGGEGGKGDSESGTGEQHSFVPILVPDWLPGAMLEEGPQAERAHDLLCLLRRMAAEVFLPPGQVPRLHLYWDQDDPSWAFIDPSGAAFFNLARDPLPAAPAAADGAAAGDGHGVSAAAAVRAAKAARARAWYLAACALAACSWPGGRLAYEQRCGKVVMRFHSRLRRAFF